MGRVIIELPLTEIRVVLRFNTGWVPGNRLKRPFKVPDDFCHHIGREFSCDTDHERLSLECISPKPMKAYVLVDFNVLTKGLDLDTIPLFLVTVTHNEAGEAYGCARDSTRILY